MDSRGRRARVKSVSYPGNWRGACSRRPLGVSFASCPEPAVAPPAVTDRTLSLVETRLWREYLELCKPRVVALIVFTAVVGMFLSTPVMVPWDVLVFATLGIGLGRGRSVAEVSVAGRSVP